MNDTAVTPPASPDAGLRSIETLRALSDAATPGPWRNGDCDHPKPRSVVRADDPPIRREVFDLEGESADVDATFIVAAVNYVRAALAGHRGSEGLSDSLDAAWSQAEAALPDGWRPVTVGPPDPDAYDVAGSAVTEPWYAGTASLAFFNGETDRDREWASGYGPTPAAALHALTAALTGKGAEG